MKEIKLPPLDEDLARTRPYAARYIQLHGRFSAMSEKYNTANMKGYKNTEDIYRECLKKGVTWQELVGVSKDLEDSLL